MSAPTIAKKISPMLAVANMEETIVFYRTVLGFNPTRNSPEYRSWSAMARPSTS